MAPMKEIFPESLRRVHQLAHWLGAPERDLVVLAEGNVSISADNDRQSFWLKSSGSFMESMTSGQFALMDTVRTIDILSNGELHDSELKHLLHQARDSRSPDCYPSTEAVLHAICLTEGGARAVGHTHPTPWLSILCSEWAEDATSGKLFPDEIVVCGPASCYVEYHDPGLPLARACRDAIRDFKNQWGVAPKLMLLQNHGIFVLGADAEEVERVTTMAVKVARALLGTFSVGGPNFLSGGQVARIHTRPDELFRKRVLAENGALGMKQ